MDFLRTATPEQKAQLPLAIAADVRAAGEDAVAGAARGGVTQDAVDWWDGVALWFVRGLVEVFDAGHKADALIPRMRVLKLRSVIRRGHRAKRAAKVTPPTPPTPVAPPTH